MMHCQKCGAENPQDAEYCLECGELFEKEINAESLADDLQLSYNYYRRIIFAFLFLIGILFIFGGIFTNSFSGFIMVVFAVFLSIYSIHKFFDKKSWDSKK